MPATSLQADYEDTPLAAKPLWEYCKKRRESLLGEDHGGTATAGSARRHKLHIGDHEIVNDGSYKAVTEGTEL